MARKLIHQFNIRFYQEDQELLEALQEIYQERSIVQNDFLKELLRKGLACSEKNRDKNSSNEKSLEQLLPLIRRTVAAAVREELHGLAVVQGENAESPEDQEDEDPDATAILDTLDQQLRGEW
jgi:hypothetical protein